MRIFAPPPSVRARSPRPSPAQLQVGDGLRQRLRLARVVLGTGFGPKDFLAYLAGGAAVLAAERLRRVTAWA